MNQQVLIQKLCQLPCFKYIKAADIKAIDDGLSQPCFCVTYKNNFYFAKYLGLNSIEATVAQLAAIQGISPDLIYVGHNWLITEFIVGEGLNTAIKSEDEKLSIMLALLSRCHSIAYKQLKAPYLPLEHSNKTVALNSSNDDQKTTKFEIPTLDILTTINSLLASLASNDAFKNRLLSLLSVLQHNLDQVANNVLISEPVLCHGDANFSNVMRVKNRDNSATDLYQLIDFECACIAPREFDIAMLLAVNEIERSKISTINLLDLQSENSDIKSGNEPLIVDNLVINGQKKVSYSISMVTCYYDLSIIVNCLWYLSEYQSNKQENYNRLAINQMSLLADYYSQAITILDKMR